ncbi:MAG: flavin reductase [Bacilli bacterium]|nr:flavin reductase [Bacilli bacterium]
MNWDEFAIRPFYDLDKRWALVTVGNEKRYNAMTISWGGFGTLWHKPVATIYIRKTRYTYEFLQDNEYFTISFYGDEFRECLGTLGSKSGRDEDKIALTKLNVEFLELAPTFKEAELTIVCKKIYSQELNKNNMSSDIVNRFYKNDEVHEMFIGEVVEIIDRRSN